MRSIKRSVNLPVAMLIAVLCVIIAYQAGASRVSPPRPAVVATVNLPKVLEGLEQRAKAEADLDSLEREFRQELERRESSLRQKDQRLTEMGERHREGEVDIAELQTLVDELDLDFVNFHAWRQFMMEKFDVEQSLLMEDLYRNIKATIGEMAVIEGYDVVIFDTSGGDLRINPESRMSRTDQVHQQILARGVLYAGERLDITSDLIQRMNNQFRAGAR